MRLISDGPDLPEALLFAHEEGRLVFFCGAGVSRPAGLPMFDGLVDGKKRGQSEVFGMRPDFVVAPRAENSI